MRTNAHDPFRAGRAIQAPPMPDGYAIGPLTVAALVDRYPPKINAGAEWMLHAMLRDLTRRGHRVVVGTAVQQHYEFEGVEVVQVAELERRAECFDVAVGHLLWTNEVIRFGARHRLPVLYLVHNDSQLAYWRMDSSKVTGLVWNSEWLAAAHENSPYAAGITSTVVRPPLVLEDYAVTVPAPADREFVTLVNPIKEKGSVLFYALAEAEPDRRFLAVEGAYGQQRRPIPDRHRNVEWQPQTPRIRDDVLARTRVLLMPSVYESWGRAAVEAMAAGIPVIASETPGLREALGDAGIFAPAPDRYVWQTLLAELDDPDVYEAASRAALARADRLGTVGARDLDTWEGFVRRAAAVGRVPGMVAHDPFRARGSVDTAPDDSDGDEDPAEVGEVPSNAKAVISWLRDAPEGPERAARADAAAAVEVERPKPRSTVEAAIAAARS